MNDANGFGKCVVMKVIMKGGDIVKVVVKSPGKDPTVLNGADNDLKTLQKEVGGYIEVISFTNDTVLICNKEGKLEGLAPNIAFHGDVVVGNIVVCSTEGEEFASLSDDQILTVTKLLRRFSI